MAARRKPARKKALKKRRSRVRTEEVRKRKKPRPRQPAKKRRAAPKKKRRASPKPKRRAVAPKKRRAAPRPAPKKRRRAPPPLPAKKKRRRAPPPPPKKRRCAPPPPPTKRRRAAPPPPPPKKKRRRAVRRPAAEGAVTRAYRAFLEAPSPTNAARRQTYLERRLALIRALENAGRSPASIRAILGWITRRQNTIRDRVARIRIAVLGTEILDATTREGWYTLRSMISERDERFLRFIRAAEAEGLDHNEAVNEWFSPKVQGA